MEVKKSILEQYSEKRPDYFGLGREDYVAMLPAKADARILEIGCGNGLTGKLAAEAGKSGEYVGVEIFEPAARVAQKHLDRVLVCDVEDTKIDYPSEYFDALIMSEVLEHLRDPDAVVRSLLHLVKRGGLVMASSPNVAHWRIISGQVMGRFDYVDEGPMDRTHLRWFTPRSFRSLFEQAGVEVESIGAVGQPGLKASIFRRLLGQRFEHLLITQINLIGFRR